MHILLQVALLVYFTPLMASTPFKIGEYKDEDGLPLEVYKQVNQGDEKLYYIELGTSMTEDKKILLSDFLVVKAKDVDLLFENLRELEGVRDNYQDQGLQIIDFDYACPFLQFSRWFQTILTSKFSDFSFKPLYDLKGYKCNLACGNINGKKKIHLYLQKRKKKLPGPKYLSYSFGSADELIKLIGDDKNTPNSGMLKAENLDNLGRWKPHCSVYKYRTKGGNFRYYIQTSDLTLQIPGNFKDYIWFNDSELSSVLGFLKALNSKWEYYSANHVYQENSEYDLNGHLDRNAINFDLVISPEIFGFIGNITGDTQIETLLNFTGDRTLTYYQSKTGEKTLNIFLYYTNDEGKLSMYFISTNGQELKSLISILEKAKQTN